MSTTGGENVNNATSLGVGVGIVCIAAGWLIYKMMSDKGKLKGSASGGGRGRSNTLTNEQKYPAGKLSIYFGSQTGTAEGFARVLMEEGRTKGFDAKMHDLENFEDEDLCKCKLAIFLMATYGEGEPTDNAARFAKWMNPEEGDSLPGCLSETSFTVFGLGNKQYEHFNRMGKTTNRELERLGGTRVHAYGEGDDDNALEDDFENWKGPMWESLVRQFHPNKGAGSGGLGSEADAAATEGPVMLSFECVDVSAAEAKKLVASPPRTSQLAASTKHFFTCKSAIVTANRELRSSEAEACAAGLDDSVLAKVGQGSVRHLELRLADTGLTYTTADNLAVLPENDPAVVAALCKALGYGSQEMTVRPCAEGGRDGDGDGGGEFKYTFPVPFTAQSALSQYFDIHGQPTLGVMKQLLPYVLDDTQKQWLRGFLAKDQREAWKQFLHSTGASVASLLLCELSSCRPPLSDLLHILPFIQPRLYTISSSSSVHPDSVHITVSVTQFELPNGKVFRGLASGFLQNIAVGAGRCRVYVRPSTFRLPTALTTPIVMVGPGTGIAPMRALLQERKFLGAKNGGANGAVGLKVPPNKNTLYFGCKHSAVDFLYKDELLAFQQEGVLTQLHTAFSRQQAEKVYVQHLVAKEPNDTDLMTDLDAGAFVFVCGDTKMGSDFMDAVVLLLQKKKGMTTEKAQGFVKELQKKGRYVQELWSDE